MVGTLTYFLFKKLVLQQSFEQVHHARSLPTSLNGQEPNTYVKVYLKPDPTKSTKRKTKVVRKNCFPSFMETVSFDNWWANELTLLTSPLIYSLSTECQSNLFNAKHFK